MVKDTTLSEQHSSCYGSFYTWYCFYTDSLLYIAQCQSCH